MFVQFSDSTETEIISIFSCPQDIKTWPNQGEIKTSDARYIAYYNALPPIAQAALIPPTS